MPRSQDRHSVLRRRAKLLGTMLAGHVGLQVITVVAGFIALRGMDIESYAQYSLAFAFGSTLGILVDFGFTGSIIALLGERAGDQELTAQYMRVARHYRSRMFMVLVPVSAFAFAAVTSGRGWSWATCTLLFVLTVTGIWFMGTLAVYVTPLIIDNSLREVYVPQLRANALRPTVFAIAATLGRLSAPLATAVNAVTLGLAAQAIRRRARTRAKEPEKPDPELGRRMRRYLRPLWPGIVFNAFQTQVLIVLMAIFGGATQIAQIGALGRLGQIFLVLVAFNVLIVEPAISRMPREGLRRRYTLLVLVMTGVVASITIVAYVWPDPFLFILGGKYDDLGPFIGPIMLTSSFEYIAQLLWTMNSARRWVYGWHTAIYITVVLIAQVIGASTINLSTTRGVVMFGVISGAALVVVQATGTVYGFRRGPIVDNR